MKTKVSDFGRTFAATNGGARNRFEVQQHVRNRRARGMPGTLAWLMATLAEGPYTSVGSYPKYWVADGGEVLSYAAVRDQLGRYARAARATERGYDRADRDPARFYTELERGWRIVGCQVNWEDPDLHCGDTGERIESAYADD